MKFEISYPDYGYSSISAVMPAAMGALGINKTSPMYINSIKAAQNFNLEKTKRICIILIDGLGYNNLKENIDKASFLKSISENTKNIQKLTTTFPSTTAVALSSLMTSSCPGSTGILGYSQFDSVKNSLMYMLKWQNCPQPQKIQKNLSIFECLKKENIESINLGLKQFKNSKLNKAITKKSKLITTNNIKKRFEIAAEVIKKTPFTYLYVEVADYITHKYGYNSPQWIENFKQIDSMLEKLYKDAPKDTLFLITADHGVLNGDLKNRTDIKDHPKLYENLTAFTGEARAVYLYTKNPDTVAKNYKNHFEDKVNLFTQEDIFEKNLFGKISTHVTRFLPNLVVVPNDNNLIVDSRSQKNETLKMIGYHGGLSHYEMEIPLLSFEK